MGVLGWCPQTAELELQNPCSNAGSHVYICTGARGGQRSTLGVLPVTVLGFETCSLDSLRIPDVAGVAGQAGSRDLPVVASRCGIGTTSVHGFVVWVLGG